MFNKRVFVSGGAGVIGSVLIQLLLQEGAQIFVGDLKPCPVDWIGKVRYRQGDLNTLSVLELQSFDPEIVFHLAATFERSEETYPFFEENFHHNIHLSHHLLQCLKECPHVECLIFASSYLIYDPILYQFSNPPIFPTLLKETSSVYPRNICGAAKFLHELELRFSEHFLKKHVSFISARIFRVYGRHSKDIISRWIRMALKGEKLSIYCPEGKFDYIFADDVAEGLLRLSKTSFSGVVNLGSGHSRSVQEVIEILKQYFPHLKTELVDCQIPFEASQADIERLTLLTKWHPSHSLESAIPTIIEFEKEKSHLIEKKENPCSVLITSISKKMPLIEAVRVAAKKMGCFIPIHGCDVDHTCIGQYGVDIFWQCPPLKDLTIEKVLDYCRQHQIRAIIPTRDQDLIFYATYQNQFKENDINVMVSSLQTIENCMDKKKFADFLSQNQFLVIPTSLAIEDLQTSAYVVKERYGAGSVELGINLNRDQALTHSQRLQSPIFQPYIKGKEWSVDVYRSRQGIVKGCVARLRDVVIQGESQITTTAVYPALEKLCEELAHYLQIEGHAIFQFIEDSQGCLHIIECNPRFGGASTASIAVGLDSFYWFFLECLEQNLQDYDFFRLPIEIRQIRYPADRIIPWLSYLT